MKYFFLTSLISLFVIFYVWQNIEMMKMKMNYNRLLEQEVVLDEERGRLLYEFEKSRNFENMKRAAESAGCKIIEPGEVYFFQGTMGKGQNKKVRKSVLKKGNKKGKSKVK